MILDTLGKARPQRRPGDDPYIADYQLGSRIKATVDAVPGAALVAVHHTRKTGAEDWLDTVSGTQGIARSADYILVLRRKRKSDEGTLAVTGRDVAQTSTPSRPITVSGHWTAWTSSTPPPPSPPEPNANRTVSGTGRSTS